MDKFGTIYGINGSVITVKDYKEFIMGETVFVSDEELMGEVIRIDFDKTLIQVFEEPGGLKPGDKITPTNKTVSLDLGPGMIGNIFDGIGRPLKVIEKETGSFITRGVKTSTIDMEKMWKVEFLVKNGDKVNAGQIVGKVVESSSVTNKITVPPSFSGIVKNILGNGEYNASKILMSLEDENGNVHDVKMFQTWPIRNPRPVKRRIMSKEPLITGQRVIDTLFPVAKGGTAAIPGGFGTGKTMTQHQLAKWSNADIIVYIGCGERGNEMTQVLEEFSNLIDPRTGNTLLDRTVLIANTSNMPVAAREASIYTGITIAEYYRDMGYDVAVMADSTSRWAEALRELSGRLEEMPAEEGFPAYLASRLSAFYERACMCETLNGDKGSITIIGAVSPQGGDFSEPVTQNTKRFVRVFWALEKSLAYARHFPSVQWLTSYSEYLNDLAPWYKENLSPDFLKNRADLMKLLNEESELMEVVKLIGSDILPDRQKLVLEVSRVIRVGFLQQNAYHDYDTYVPLKKQEKMMEIILYLYKKSLELVDMSIPVSVLKKESIFDDIIGIKYTSDNENIDALNKYFKSIDDFYMKLYKENK